MNPIQWTVEEEIATLHHPTPQGGPEGKIFVSPKLCTSLVDSAQHFWGTGHAGSKFILSLLSIQYWLAGMTQDISRFVKGCSVYAISKTIFRLPEG